MSWVICSTIFNSLPILCYGTLFSTTINWEQHKEEQEKYLQGYHHSKLFGDFLLFLVLELCNYVNKNFLSYETNSYVKISTGFFQHF